MIRLNSSGYRHFLFGVSLTAVKKSGHHFQKVLNSLHYAKTNIMLNSKIMEVRFFAVSEYTNRENLGYC